MPFDAIGSETGFVCPVCSESFIKKRSDQKFCTPRCRKQNYQSQDRKKNPKNAQHSPDVKEQNRKQRLRARELASTLFGMPPNERLGFMKKLIDAARSYDAKLRSIFTDPRLLNASHHERWLFHRMCPASYPTISQAGNAYCQHFWNASVTEVVKGRTPDPPTGTVSS